MKFFRLTDGFNCEFFFWNTCGHVFGNVMRDCFCLMLCLGFAGGLGCFWWGKVRWVNVFVWSECGGVCVFTRISYSFVGFGIAMLH